MTTSNGNGANGATAVRTPTINLLSLPADPGAPQQLPTVRFDLYQESIFRTIYQDGQPIAYDEVSPLDLAAAFADVDPAGDLLPQNTLFCRKRRHSQVAIYIPPSARTLEVDGVGKFTIPLPALVFAGQGDHYAIFALAQPGWPAADSRLYHAPFPNVYDSGRICQGSAEFPPVSPETIHEAAEVFFTSKFNHDLASNKSQAHPSNIIEQWRALRGNNGKSKSAYPVEDLKPAGKLLGELWL